MLLTVIICDKAVLLYLQTRKGKMKNTKFVMLNRLKMISLCLRRLHFLISDFCFVVQQTKQFQKFPYQLNYNRSRT